ncbi:ATP-dependent DNA helicase MER3, partial [Dipsacomyces acuminosporus]
VLQQIDGIGPRYAQTLWDNGIRSILDLQELSVRDVEHSLNRNPPFGTKILANAAAIPSCSVEVTSNWVDRQRVVFTFKVYCAFKAKNASDGKQSQPTCRASLIAYTSDGVLLTSELIVISPSAYYETQAGLCNPTPGSSITVVVAPEKYRVGSGLGGTTDTSPLDELLLDLDDPALSPLLSQKASEDGVAAAAAALIDLTDK